METGETCTTFRVYHHQGTRRRVVFRTTDPDEAREECRRRNQEQIDADGHGSGHFWTTDADDVADR